MKILLEEGEGRLVKAGTIRVEAGLCLVGDPCHIVEEDGGIHGLGWTEFVASFAPKGDQQFSAAGEENEGVLAYTGLGDGLYSVYAVMNEGRCMGLVVDFGPDEDSHRAAINEGRAH